MPRQDGAHSGVMESRGREAGCGGNAAVVAASPMHLLALPPLPTLLGLLVLAAIMVATIHLIRLRW